jgi:nitrate/TMAO reductase-like tetraheme cytochrome c subunit
MMRNLLICGVAAIFLCVAGAGLADKGPADMILQAEKDKAKKPKPAVFPHAKHQEIATCADCHHSAKDGKQIAYVDGQDIQKCESCHFKGNEMAKKIASYKNAAHKNCRDCHKAAAAKDPSLKEKFSKCMPCHVKK